jgi:hypothetical protein
MIYLKADTAVEIPIGPIVAVGDGFTPVTTLSIASADEAELIKYNGNTALTTTAIAGTVAAITGADGYYTLDLSVTDTNTEGFLIVAINDDSLILPFKQEFMVVNANVYDSLFAVAGTDLLQVDQTQIAGGTVPTPTTTGVPDVNVERWLDTLVTLGAGAPDVNVASMDAGSIAAGTIAAGELTNIENEIWDALKSAHVVANSFGDFLDIEVSSRLASADINLTGGAVDTVTTVTNDVGISTTAVDNIWDEALSGHSTGGTTGKALNNAASFIVTDGTCQATGQTSTNIRIAAGESATNDIYKNDLIVITGGTGAGESALITAYDGTNKDCTVSPALVITCDGTSVYEVVPAHTHAENLGADAVDANALADNAIDAAAIAASALNGKGDWNIGKTGYALSGAGVDAILDETLTSHVTADSLGVAVKDILADTNELQTDDYPTSIAAIQSDTDDIQTRLPAALVGGRMDSNMSAIDNDNTAAVNLKLSTLQVISGSVETGGGPTTTVFQTDLAETQDDIYIGRIIIFTSGAAKDEATDITDYTGSTGTITCTALANAPANTDTFIII